MTSTWWCIKHIATAPHDRAKCWYAVAKMNDRSGTDPGPCSLFEKHLVSNEVPDFIIGGVTTDGGHHKQWFLEQIAEFFELRLPDHEEGIAP